MSNRDWMDRILDDSRDRALQVCRATIQSQAQELAQAEAQIAELSGRCEAMAVELAAKLEQLAADSSEVQRELAAARAAVATLEFEYGKAAVRGRASEAHFLALVRRLLGRSGAHLLLELVEAADLDDLELRSEPERLLVHRLEQDS